MRSRAGPITEISAFTTEISVTGGTKIFPYEHSSPGDRGKAFSTKQFHFRVTGAKMRLCVFALRVCELTLEVKSQLSYDSREWYNFLCHLFGFVSWTSFWSTGLKFPVWTDNCQNSPR